MLSSKELSGPVGFFVRFINSNNRSCYLADLLDVMVVNTSNIAIILARGGSKRLPRKNILELEEANDQLDY